MHFQTRKSKELCPVPTHLKIVFMSKCQNICSKTYHSVIFVVFITI